jgi:hypothetical protein
MRTYVNLASRPFNNHRPYWIALLAVFFISLWLLLWITSQKTLVSAEVQSKEVGIKAQEEQVRLIREEAAKNSQPQQKVEMSEQQAFELAAARQLIERKSFLWNKLIGDIENYVPKDARILAIKVEEVVGGSQNVVAAVEIKAAGKTPAQMTEMMASLEKSGGKFEIVQAGQDALSETGEVPFTLKLTYSPVRGNA